MPIADDDQDVELKFDGPAIQRLGGTPAELLAETLRALQRMAHLIGMKKEGQRFGHKARPNAKVRRTYAVICRPAEPGSYKQPWNLVSATGQGAVSTHVARGELLKALRAFDSGDDAKVAELLPDARQRWFLADAALGLLPPEDSEIEVSLRVGLGHYSFKAGRARATIERTRAGDPPVPEAEEIVGKLKALDFSRAQMTIKPNSGRQIRVHYPMRIEPFLQRNVRRRLRVAGAPEINGAGDVVGFKNLLEISEIEPTSKRIDAFVAGDLEVKPHKSFGYLVGFDFNAQVFFARDPEVGLDVFSSDDDALETEVRADLNILWRTYALASDNELTSDAQLLKKALRSRLGGRS